MQRNVCRIDSTRYGIMRMCAIDSIAIHSIDDDEVGVMRFASVCSEEIFIRLTSPDVTVIGQLSIASQPTIPAARSSVPFYS